MKEPVDLLIHIPISNREWALPDFTRGLFSQRMPESIRTIRIIFDVNDSKDRTLELLGKAPIPPFVGKVTVCIRENAFPHIDAGEHQWPAKRVERMTAMRNRALRDAREHGARYLFSIDSDVILTEPDTLAHLLSLDMPIVAGVFFTRWGNRAADPLPNVWQSGRNEMSDAFLMSLKAPGHHPVGGLGACTLIRSDVIEAGVTYDRVYNAPTDYDGEDRHFCLRAAVAGFTMMACTCKRIVHIDKVWNDPENVLPWKCAAS